VYFCKKYIIDAHEPSLYEVNMALEKFKRHKSPGIDQIPAELFIAGGRKILSEITQLINSIWNKKEVLRSGRSPSMHLFIRKAIKQNVVIIEAYHICQLCTKFYPAVKVYSKCPNTEVCIEKHECGFRRSRSVTDHIYFTFVKSLRKNGNTINKTINKCIGTN